MPVAAVEFLKGEHIYLRPVEEQDYPTFYRWMNEPATRALIGETGATSQEAVKAYFERVNSDSSRAWFAVVTRADDRLIGETGLLRMFPAWRCTDMSIIIYDQTARGKGYGQEAVFLMLNHAFGFLNFHRVAIGVVGFNHRALAFYEKMGFAKEGIQREGYYYNHQYHDFVMMSILEDDFRARWQMHIQQGMAGCSQTGKPALTSHRVFQEKIT